MASDDVTVQYDLSKLNAHEAETIATELRRAFPFSKLAEIIVKALMPRGTLRAASLSIPKAPLFGDREEYGQVQRWAEQYVGHDPSPRTAFMRALVNAIDEATRQS